MEKYNYFEAVKADVAEWIKNEIDLTEYAGRREDLEEELNDTLWTADSVTGNGSGSYTFNTWKAEENLAHNWEDITEAAWTFCIDAAIDDEHGPEFWDVTIRCYYLNSAINAVLDEMEENGAFDEAADDENSAA